MTAEDSLRDKVSFRISPLLELGLSLLVMLNPERFAPVDAWVQRVASRLQTDVLDKLRKYANDTDFLGLVAELESERLPASQALEHFAQQSPELGRALTGYWEALAPEVAANAGVVGESLQRESARLQAMDPVQFICDFSDRVSISEDGKYLDLEWGKGMRVPLDRLDRLILVPSTFCPRRLMFYRHDTVEFFFYNPLHRESPELTEPPESLLLGFSALADSTRLKLVKLIAREDLPAQEMARRLDLHESTVSRHLRFLTEAGLVARERQEGKYIFYSLNMSRIDTLVATLRAYITGRRAP